MLQGSAAGQVSHKIVPLSASHDDDHAISGGIPPQFCPKLGKLWTGIPLFSTFADYSDIESPRLEPRGLDLLGPPVSGFCDKFQAAAPSLAVEM